MGAQLTGVVPPKLLGGQPVHALDETALDLAEIAGRVKRLTGVMQNIHAAQAVFAGQGIHLDFRHCGPVREIVERAPLVGLGIIMDLRRAVVSGG
jgi:hypothetical protein